MIVMELGVESLQRMKGRRSVCRLLARRKAQERDVVLLVTLTFAGL